MEPEEKKLITQIKTRVDQMLTALCACHASLTEIERDHPEWMRPCDKEALEKARAAILYNV